MKSKKKAASYTSGPEAWLFFAQDDLKAAKKLLEDGQWIHSLGKLIELCAKTDRTFLRLKSFALSLDRYYIPTRYPEASPGSLPDGLPLSTADS